MIDNRIGLGLLYKQSGRWNFISKGSYLKYQQLAFENGQLSVDNNLIDILFLEGGIEQQVGRNDIYSMNNVIKYVRDHEDHFHMRF